MNECLNCKKPITQTEGRRKKVYCSDSCRAAFNQKKNAGKKQYVRIETFEAMKKELTELRAAMSSRLSKQLEPEKIKVPLAYQPKPDEPAAQLSDYDKKEAESRIKDIESELRNPPSKPLIGMWAWKKVRVDELEKLKKQLQ